MPKILWRQVWGLAALLAAILLGFTIYGIYQPDILTQLGFDRLALGWGLLQGVGGAIIEPSLGYLSDWILRRTGSRLPQITVGVTVAGLVFVVVAGLMPLPSPWTLRWPVLLLMLVWLSAMIAIRGPVVALLRQFAPVDQLPIANGVLILVLGLVAALGPILTELLGAQSNVHTGAILFLVGAIALLLGATVLYRTGVPLVPPAVGLGPDSAGPDSAGPDMAPQPRTLAFPNVKHRRRITLTTIFLIGVGTGSVFYLVVALLPSQFGLGFLTTPQRTAIALVIAALTANPWGYLILPWGPARALQLGVLGLVGLLGLTGLGLQALGLPTWGALAQPSPALGGVAGLIGLGTLGALEGLVMISTVPFALSYVPPSAVGLSAGLFFGGNGLGSALMQLGFPRVVVEPLGVALGWGAIAGLGTILLLQWFSSSALTQKSRPEI